jgi:hypothetical protein
VIKPTMTRRRALINRTEGCPREGEAFVIDYAGSRGKVTLSAEAEINLRMTASKFDGTLLAWAQRPVRMLVPFGFVTRFQAVVNRSQDFVSRADFCSNVKHERKNGLYVFTYAGDGSAAPERVHLINSFEVWEGNDDGHAVAAANASVMKRETRGNRDVVLDRCIANPNIRSLATEPRRSHRSFEARVS